MGSRYSIGVFRGLTLPEFTRALGEKVSIGPEAAGPWEGPTGVTAAQIDTASGQNVVIAGPPEGLPPAAGERFARQLGVEALFATVRDIVSTYSLIVVGEGIDRELFSDPQAFGEGHLDSLGEPLPEEPARPALDEAYVQVVLSGRCGIDPARLQTYDAVWYALDG